MSLMIHLHSSSNTLPLYSKHPTFTRSRMAGFTRTRMLLRMFLLVDSRYLIDNDSETTTIHRLEFNSVGLLVNLIRPGLNYIRPVATCAMHNEKLSSARGVPLLRPLAPIARRQNHPPVTTFQSQQIPPNYDPTSIIIMKDIF